MILLCFKVHFSQSYSKGFRSLSLVRFKDSDHCGNALYRLMLTLGERKLATILISFMLFFRLYWEKPRGDFSKKVEPGLAYCLKCEERLETYISPLVVLV